MAKDKYTAVWVSHSSSSDFLRCRRAYYLKNVYKDPKTGHKIQIMSPPLALGQAVHEVLESLSVLPTEKRFAELLVPKYDIAWKKVGGKSGGFPTEETERKYKERGRLMLKRVLDNPGPLANLAVKIKMDLPYYWLSEEDNIILCGKIDWLEYLPKTDSVHIIDFKTGKTEEDPKSLQLPIYHLIVSNCQKRSATKASYWYLDRSDKLESKRLPKLEKAQARVLEIAKKIKLARQLQRFPCSRKSGCSACRPFESVLRGEAEYVGLDEYNRDVYVLGKLAKSQSGEQKRSVVL